MVTHQDIRVKFELVSLSVVFEPFQIILPIRVTAENHLPLIATADRMVKRAGEFHSRFAGHSGLICHKCLITEYET
jgi:hypothetical protein